MQKKEKEKERRSVELFFRYCQDRYTRQDLKEIFAWFENRGFNIFRRISLNQYWKSFDQNDETIKDPEYDQERMLDQLHHQINIENKRAKSQEKHFLSQPKVIQAFYRIAAVLVIPLLVLNIVLYIHSDGGLSKKDISYTEVYAPQNSKLSIILGDGTEVWLNHGSLLKYPREFSGKQRKVELVGEAYFNVAKDPSRPFHVRASELDVKVLGTSFNLSAYEDDKTVITTVEEGEVVIYTMDSDNNMKPLTELKPCLQATYHKDTEENWIKRVNPEEYTGWKEGKLMLVDDPMPVVIKKLERWYNVDIEIRDPELYLYKYTSTFVHEPIQQVLELMSIATPIQYHIEQGNRMADNSYSKMKITIDIKK